MDATATSGKPHAKRPSDQTLANTSRHLLAPGKDGGVPASASGS
jgi:hypothetical protein